MGGKGNFKRRDVERAFDRGGAKARPGKGSHVVWVYPTKDKPDGAEVSIPRHGDEIKFNYIRKARKTWYITEADGVCDADFWGGKWRVLPDDTSKADKPNE